MKMKVFIHAQYSEWEKEFRFSPWGSDLSSCKDMGYVLVEQQEIEFAPPPHDVLIGGTVEAYKAQQKAVAAEAERKHNEIQQRINDLLCIEYKPETA